MEIEELVDSFLREKGCFNEIIYSGQYPIIFDISKIIIENIICGILEIPKGTFVGILDFKGNKIHIGDICGYEHETGTFEVVFEDGKARKQYLDREWPNYLPKPELNADLEELRTIVKTPYKK